jgi:branched-chain amino acid transport system substrate-binding protein
VVRQRQGRRHRRRASSIALAINQITKEKGKVFLVSGAASSDLTGRACSPNTVHWTYDTWMLANGTGGAIVKTGGDTWFFLTADYAFGLALERDTEAVVLRTAARSGAPSSERAGFFLVSAQAQHRKPGHRLANAGGDTTNAIKQAAEFSIVRVARALPACWCSCRYPCTRLPTAQGWSTNTFY